MNTNFTITTQDGYPLAARHYSADKPKANIILAGATGVPQAFYRRFAEYAATYGYNVITFDYRGIGRSKPADFKNFDIVEENPRLTMQLKWPRTSRKN